jgi:hypothetical protein
MRIQFLQTFALSLIILAGFSAAPIQAQSPIGQYTDLIYQGQAALARDWASAFQKMGLKQVRLKVLRASANISSASGTSLAPNLLLDAQFSVYSDVISLTEIGPLLLIQYQIPQGLTSMAVIRADQVLGMYP